SAGCSTAIPSSPSCRRRSWPSCSISSRRTPTARTCASWSAGCAASSRARGSPISSRAGRASAIASPGRCANSLTHISQEGHWPSHAPSVRMFPMPSTAARLFCPVCLAVFRQVFRRCPADGAVLDEIGEEPLLGAVLGGRYLIQSLIGEGGMGRVYFATDETGTGRFAIKVLYGELTAEPRQYERFVREAARAASFEHPNLVRVLDFGSTSGGQPYAVMEHVPGASLSRIIRSG